MYEEIKHIYITNSGGGFGNKIFNLIFAMYLYKKYDGKYNKCIINYVIEKSAHDMHNDPTFDNIFLKFKGIINITESIPDKDKYIEIKNNNYKNLNEFPQYEELKQFTYFNSIFQLTYDMYEDFNQTEKDLFTIDTSLIRNKTKINEILQSTDSFAIIHIRYGDKLNYKEFITYTPDYYIDKIKELQLKNPYMNIYIISDSDKIVNYFILNETYDKYNTIIDKSKVILLQNFYWLDSFYLLYYAKYIIMSLSTFCMAGAFFNVKQDLECYLCIPESYQKKQTEDYLFSPKWNIDTDTNSLKYILNSSENDKLCLDIKNYYQSKQHFTDIPATVRVNSPIIIYFIKYFLYYLKLIIKLTLISIIIHYKLYIYILL